MANKRFPIPNSTLGALLFTAWAALLFADVVAKRVEDYLDSKNDWFEAAIRVEGDTIECFPGRISDGQNQVHEGRKRGNADHPAQGLRLVHHAGPR